jgi:hypothetical protein
MQNDEPEAILAQRPALSHENWPHEREEEREPSAADSRERRRQ